MTNFYFARCKCGCGSIIAASVDEPKYAKESAMFMAELIRDGYVVEHQIGGKMAVNYCKQKKPAAAQSRAQGEQDGR